MKLFIHQYAILINISVEKLIIMSQFTYVESPKRVAGKDYVMKLMQYDPYLTMQFVYLHI